MIVSKFTICIFGVNILKGLLFQKWEFYYLLILVSFHTCMTVSYVEEKNKLFWGILAAKLFCLPSTKESHTGLEQYDE